MAGPNSPKLAVLIDADNTTPAIVASLLAEIAKYGTATVKRAYGDWTTPRLGGWKDANNSHAIQPMQQFAYTTGKNATDSALIIDAMDLLYTGNLDGFCLVSSDSDFTKLASRLRESGKTVYGFGEPKTPKALVAACDKFVYLDVLRSREKREEPDEDPASPAPKRKSSADLRRDDNLVRLLREGVDASSDDDGWAYLGTVGSYIAKQAPDFDSRNWGFAKLVDLVGEIGLFDVERPPGQQIRVREKPRGRTTKKAAATKTTPRKSSRPAAAQAPADEVPAGATAAQDAAQEAAPDTVETAGTPVEKAVAKATRPTRSRSRATKATKAADAEPAEAPVAADQPPADQPPAEAEPARTGGTTAQKKTVTRRAVKSMQAAPGQ